MPDTASSIYRIRIHCVFCVCVMAGAIRANGEAIRANGEAIRANGEAIRANGEAIRANGRCH